MSKPSDKRIRPSMDKLVAAVNQFDTTAEIEQLRKEEIWLKYGHNSKTLVKLDDLRMVLMLIKAGTQIKEHKAAGSISIQTLIGRLRIHLPEETIELPAGHVLTLGQEHQHDVEAMEESALLLTISWPKKEAIEPHYPDLMNH